MKPRRSSHSGRSQRPARRDRARHGSRPHYSAHGSREKIYIYGKHALMEALAHAPHAVRKVFLSPEVNDPELRTLLRNANLTPGVLKNNEIDRVVGRDTAHQGVIAVT